MSDDASSDDTDDCSSLPDKVVYCFVRHQTTTVESSELEVVCDGCFKTTNTETDEISCCDGCRLYFCVECDNRWINYQCYDT